MAQYAREYDELKQKIKALEVKADKRKNAILDEMERRGTIAIEHEGARISYVVNESVRYSIEALKEKLAPSLFRAITKPVVDPAALSAKVQAGAITQDTVAACSSLHTSAPYIRVSFNSED
jgi:hypothetical protein